MTTSPLRSAWIFLLALAVLAGCGPKRPPLTSLAPDELFRQASAAFEARRYGRAAEMLNVFVQQHAGDPRVPEAWLMLARSHMARREYVPAVSEFQRLITDYPSSPYGREARFGICEAYYRLSPHSQLDQENTYSAILHCRSIAEYYPGTPEAQRATAWATELQNKLARKAYDNGIFYFRRRAYDAAIVYFTEVVQNYPETRYAPSALAQLVETYTRLGYREEATEARDRLRRDYPQSPEARALADGPAPAG